MTGRKFAVFDIDGTLLRWQLYHSAVNTLAKRGLLGERTYEELRSIRSSWKNREHPEAFKEYERHMVKMYDAAVSGVPVSEFEAAARQTVAEHKQQVYTYTRDLITSLKNNGYFMLTISGSHKEMVEELAEFYGFDDFVGSTYEIKDGVFTGNKMIAAEDKARHLNEMIKKHGLSTKDSVGVGDTASDIAMLEMVDTPIAFNPEQRLLEAAKGRGWKIVVERKNVIYELEQSGGVYKLV